MPKVSDTSQRIINYIHDFNEEKGFPPTIREICDGVGLRSPGGVHRHVTQLKEKGILVETAPCSVRTLAVRSNVNLDATEGHAKHLCLQTSDGGSLILDCRVVNGRIEFNGPIRATGMKGSQVRVVGCRELNEDDYFEAMVI